MAEVEIGFWLLLAYMFGSIPTSVWYGRAFHGIDVREHGSLNAGATNTFRVLGSRAGSIVFVIDVMKGFTASMMAFMMLQRGLINRDQFEYWQIACGMAGVIGHIFPLFAGFRGGKGVATLLGMTLYLHPQAALCTLGFFVLVFRIWGYVSLGSMLSGLVFPILMLTLFPGHPALVVYGFVVFGLLIFTHRANIQRLRTGTEKKLQIFGPKTSW